jgi:SAM-dependent methyltransferase
MDAVYRAGRRSRVVVRQSRRGRTLEIDGTFASFWRPGKATTGSVWDALAIPLLALPAARRRSVLLLGLGGASAARLVRTVAPRARIVGVEIDAEVVRAARRWFGLDALRVSVRRADARVFLARERRRFDLVLDDVFVGSGVGVRKPDWLPEPGLAWAARRVARGGVLATNVLEEGAHTRRVLRRLFPAVLEIRVADYDNRILVGGPSGLHAGALRRAVLAEPHLRPTLSRLTFRTLPGRQA